MHFKNRSSLEKLTKRKKTITLILTMLIIIGCTTIAYAATPPPGSSPDTKLDTLISTIAGWLQKAGGLLGLFGVVQTVWSIAQDDADSKSRGIKFAIAGFAVFAVATGYSAWIA